MTYSCTDFVDTILDALQIVVPPSAWDDPSAQADLALKAIADLKAGPRAPERIRKAIYVTGHKGRGYDVQHNLPGVACVISVPKVHIANTIVRALRSRATQLEQD